MRAIELRFQRVVVAFLAVALAACSGDSDPTGPGSNNPGSDNTVASITVTPGTASMEVGSTTQFQAQAQNSNGSALAGVSFTWSSSNATVATVNNTGLATGEGGGTTSITATSGGASGAASLTVTERPPQFTGFDFSLAQGDYWDFYWSYEYNSASGPQMVLAPGSSASPAQASSHSVTGGHFRITLGSAISLDGVQVFELVMSGDYEDGDWDYTPRWQYLGIDGHAIVGSLDGTSIKVVFDAENGAWTGGGFWAEYGDETEVEASENPLDNEFISTDAVSVNRSAGQDFCENIAGHTVCPNDQAWSFSEAEYYKGGIGPLGLYSYSGFSFSGGGFFDSFSHLRHVGLVASSLAGAVGVVPTAPPWLAKAPMPTARANHAAAVVDDKIYVFGGELRTVGGTVVLASVDVYDPVADAWMSAAPMPDARSGHTATAHGGKVYVVGGTGASGGAQANVWEYDPLSDSWTSEGPAATVLSGHSAVEYGSYILVYPATNTDAYAYEVGADEWWAITSSPNRFDGHATATAGTSVFVMGGSYRDLGFGGYYTRYTGANLAFDPQEPYDSANAWTHMASMPTGRANLALAEVGGEIFAIGGSNADGPARVVERYDPASDTWMQRFPLMSGIKDHVAAVVNGKVYVIGGSGYWDSIVSVFEYDPANEW